MTNPSSEKERSKSLEVLILQASSSIKGLPERPLEAWVAAASDDKVGFVCRLNTTRQKIRHETAAERAIAIVGATRDKRAPAETLKPLIPQRH